MRSMSPGPLRGAETSDAGDTLVTWVDKRAPS